MYIPISILLASTTGSISVSSTPSGASIYIDVNYQGTTPINITKIEKGSHTITLKLTGYQDWSQNINVIAGETYYFSPSLTFIQTTGSISVSSSPSGVSVYLDGNYKGTTPINITKIENGLHTINISNTGYQDWSQSINVIAGETNYLSPTLIIIPIDFSAYSSPSGASVYLDGIYKGITPLTDKIEKGSHTITLKLVGYRDWSQTINVTTLDGVYISPMLTKLLNQAGSVTIYVGDSADVGSGYTLTINSIDAKASPRQVWLVLTRNGIKLDDKSVSEGGVYTFIKPINEVIFKATISNILVSNGTEVKITDISYVS